MSESRDKSIMRIEDVLNALERCFWVGGSPGVKLAAGIAFEILTGRGLGGRPLPAKTRAKVTFAVSVTILSPSMEHLLIRASRRGFVLPRVVLTEESSSLYHEARQLSRSVSGDQEAELALLGRPLAIELWDDNPEEVVIGLNFLAISRAERSREVLVSSGWAYVDLKKLDLNAMDPRESLGISEMLTTMGFTNPYDMTDEEQTPLGFYNAAS